MISAYIGKTSPGSIAKGYHRSKDYWGDRVSSGGMKTGAGRFATDLKEGVGLTNKRGDRLADEADQLQSQRMGETRGVLDQMTRDDESYYNATQKTSNELKGDISRYADEAQQQANDATRTYKDLSSRAGSVMSDLGRQQKDIMTLGQAGDPNNAIHQKVRGMYEQQAQGVNRTGLASAGVLQNLGAQAFSNQMGGGIPMTGGQMQLMASASQQQAGDAFARTQQQMQSLREQGIERGFQESDKQYNRGQDLRRAYQDSIGQNEDMSNRYQDNMRQYRGEGMGYANQRAGIDYGQANIRHDLSGGQQQRELGYIGENYGGKEERINSRIGRANADQQRKLGVATGLITGGMTAAGAAAGGMAGGPEGAMYGAQAGKTVGQQYGNTYQNMATPPQQPYYRPQVGQYGYNNPYQYG